MSTSDHYGFQGNKERIKFKRMTNKGTIEIDRQTDIHSSIYTRTRTRHDILRLGKNENR